MNRWAWMGLGAWLLAAVAVGCGDDDGGGTPVDGGTGTEDAGMDAAVSVLDCEGTVEDVYVTPEDLPAYTEEAAGEVVRCAEAEPLSADRIQAVAALNEYEGPTLAEASRRFFLSYRTPRASGEGGLSSGVLYVPTTMPETPKPLVLLAHGTTGMGDPCAPSRADMEERNMKDTMRLLLPLIGNGHAVMMPDYIGVGTEGTHGFLVVDEAAHTVLDGIRAAMRIAPEGMLSGEVVLMGHSQGGHAVMAAQAAKPDYAPELDIIGVNALAPPWFDIVSVGLLLAAPGEPVDGRANFASMFSVGHEAAYNGEENALRPITPDLREAYETLYAENCHVGQTARLGELASSVGELFSSSYRDAVSQCVNLGLCSDRGMFWKERLAAHLPTLDADGAPIRVHLGTLDDTMDHEKVGCTMEDLKAAGIPVDTCIYEGVTHGDMALAPWQWTLDWIDALVSGDAEPACEPVTFCEEPMMDGGMSDGGVPDGGMDGGV